MTPKINSNLNFRSFPPHMPFSISAYYTPFRLFPAHLGLFPCPFVFLQLQPKSIFFFAETVFSIFLLEIAPPKPPKHPQITYKSLQNTAKTPPKHRQNTAKIPPKTCAGILFELKNSRFRLMNALLTYTDMYLYILLI